MERISLEIGDVPLRLACSAPLAATVVSQYGGFIHDSGRAALDIEVDFDASAPTLERHAKLELDRSRLPWSIRSFSFVAELDPRARRGRVTYNERYPYPEGALPPGLQLGIRAVTCLTAVLNGGLALHASGVVLNGRGLTFLGPSEAGKTTIAYQLERAAHATLLADDIVIATFEGALPTLHATPFSGRNQPVHTRKRGNAIWTHGFALEQTASNFRVEPLTEHAAYRLLMKALLVPENDHELAAQVADQADRYFKAVSWRSVAFDLSPERSAGLIAKGL